MSQEKILLIIERDSYQKDAVIINALVESLADTGYKPLWYNPHGVGSSQIVTTNPFINALPKFLRYPIKALGLFLHPRRLKHYLSLDAWRESSIDGRIVNLKKFVRRLGDASVVVFSRSAGGRIASITADELGIEKIICLGYPFRFPGKPDEPGRFAHLKDLRTPMLIVQGTQDEYGGSGVTERYELSPGITIEFVETDHDFQISDEQFNHVVSKIKQFMSVF